MTLAGPPYDDVVPFGRTLVERFPDRVLWGTDWRTQQRRKRPTMASGRRASEVRDQARVTLC
jgi:predicted TIM-barrel fold metal-dependent hydrolase